MPANVYYSLLDQQYDLKIELKSLWAYLISMRDSKDSLFRENKDIFYCPAVRERMQRIFFVPSPRDFNRKSSDKVKVGLKGLSHVRLPHQLLMVSDEPVIASCSNPFFHIVSDTQSVVVPSFMNINSWYRPIIFSYLSKDATVSRLKNEPLMYVEFDKPVVLHEYNFTSELKTLINIDDESKRRGKTGNNKYVSLNNTYLETNPDHIRRVIDVCKLNLI